MANSDQKNEWIFEGLPTVPGWYAISYTWDAREGVSCGSAYWTENKFSPARPVVAHAGPFENESDAEKWAYDHDIDS